ncbi:MAG: AAA family ATPase [Verrucomicrobia bacterium RIFCSPHIGHO2_12_FULL_41_10]|nr:MAG: AAA family ATPase [Verrucomicrobia bacterium RIFCSPHIGHO2_12_FULL_41_10]
MDPILNPYTPGAGAPPPELAGRDKLLNKAGIILKRITLGRFERSLILTGLRGVGKTVLLNRIRQEAEAAKIATVRVEISENRSLPALLAPALKAAMLKLSRGKAASELTTRGLRALASFVKAMKLRYGDIEIGIAIEPESHSFMTPDLDDSLSQLFQSLGALAKEKKTAVVLFIDELQVLDEKSLAALVMAFHVAAQDLLPITMVAAGLPQILGKMGAAKTYAERLFEFPEIGRLDHEAATQALVIPAKKLKVNYTEGALKEILQQSEGYAYFLQEWGKHAWDIASMSPITEKDAKEATIHAVADLDASFFRVRFDQLTPLQKRYLRAMAELGPQPCSSGQIAQILDKKVTDLGTIREQLISKGLIYSASYGETTFTVPLFDAFMRRTITE